MIKEQKYIIGAMILIIILSGIFMVSDYYIWFEEPTKQVNDSSQIIKDTILIPDSSKFYHVTFKNENSANTQPDPPLVHIKQDGQGYGLYINRSRDIPSYTPIYSVKNKYTKFRRKLCAGTIIFEADSCRLYYLKQNCSYEDNINTSKTIQLGDYGNKK